MTIKQVLKPFAFVAALALTAAPALAGQHRGEGRRSSGRSEGRSYSGSRYRGGGGVAIRGGGSLRGGSSFNRAFYARSHFSRPYYSFRPRVSLGLGLWIGYPVTYPYYYNASPYAPAYSYTDPYGYEAAPAPGESAYPRSDYPGSDDPEYGSSAQPYRPQPSAPAVRQRSGEQSSEGGISFEITPENAEVFVDGDYMGAVADFGPTAQPLGLSAGRHHIELRASGFRTMTFDADVRPAQVIPYQGTLQRN